MKHGIKGVCSAKYGLTTQIKEAEQVVQDVEPTVTEAFYRVFEADENMFIRNAF
ncbi:hypothetical protein [Desulfobacterium sp. N47]|uniref:Uncharacterized protein n=1 Tax=uncultured Desulfobacterium sp. TaxID=201089 RepID=E1YF19_9BACT|nr:unknown protein [uncultured Desulfobacterium sp.]